MMHFTSILAAVVQMPGEDNEEICPADVHDGNPETECEDCIELLATDRDLGLPVSLLKSTERIYSWTSPLTGMHYTECLPHLACDEYARLATTYEYRELLRREEAAEYSRNHKRQAAKYGVITEGLQTSLPDHVIVAAFRLPDRGGLMPGQHVVIARPLGNMNAEDNSDNHSHTVWYMWPDRIPNGKKWIRHEGAYDLSWNRALDEFKRRIDINYGTRI